MEFQQEQDQEGEMEMEMEMAVPISSTYGGHQNHIVPLSLQQQHHQPPPSMEELSKKMVVVVRYKECLKNHAVSMGGKATDGCGEFMPSGEDGTLEAFTCSVCNCHRNFHKKEIENDPHHHHHHHIPTTTLYDCNHHTPPPNLKRFELGNLILHPKGFVGTESFGYNHMNNAGTVVPSIGPPSMMTSYNMGMGPFPSESDDHQVVRKRFRTKFTQEQKEKMLSFAEKVGWKIQKQEESVVQEFCQEVGIKRRVLKVWMHNNKQNLAKNTTIDPPQHPN